MILFLWMVVVLLVPNLMGQSIEEFLQHSAQLEENHLLLQAKEITELGLKKHPDEPLLLLQLGKLLLRIGQNADAEVIMERALAFRPDDPRFLEAAGEARLRQGKRSEAIRLFSRSLRYQPSAAESHHQLAFAYLMQSNDAQALEHSRKAIAANPTQSRYRRLYVLLLETVERREEAYQQLRAAYQLSKQDPRLLLQLSEMKRTLGDKSGTLEYLDMALQIDPENPLYYDRLAELYQQLGQHGESQLNATKAGHLREGFQSYLKALQHKSEGQVSAAIRILEGLVTTHPALTSGAILLADLYLKQGRNDSALTTYLQVLKKDPRQAIAREQAAWIQLKNGLPASAQQLLTGSQSKSLNQSLVAGYRYLVERKWSVALQQFQEAEKRIPLDTNLLQLIAACWSALGREKEAMKYLAKAAAIRPSDNRIQDQIGEVEEKVALRLMEQKKWSQAVDAFQKLIRQRGLRSDDLFRLAYSHQQLGQLKEAVTRYRIGLAASPDSAWARTNLASCFYLLRRYREAAEELSILVQANPSPQRYFQLALCYSHLNRSAEAAYAFQKMLKLDPENPQALYQLGLTRQRQNRTQEASFLIRRSAARGYAPAQSLLVQIKRKK